MLPISFKVVWAAIINAWDVRDRRVGYVVGTGASTSMAPTAHGAASLQVDIAAGNYSKNGADSSTVYAGGNITLTAADATNPRVDIVYMSSGGTLSKTDGTAAAIVAGVSGPVPPAWPAGCCPLAICFVPNLAIDFTGGGYVLDARPFGVVPVSASGGTPALTLGTANAAGVATTFIREDDTILAFDATAPTTAAFNDAAAVGAATVAARRDHKHGMMDGILRSIITTAGDLILGTGNDAVARLGIGTEGRALRVVGGTAAWANDVSSPSTWHFNANGNAALPFEQVVGTGAWSTNSATAFRTGTTGATNPSSCSSRGNLRNTATTGLIGKARRLETLWEISSKTASNCYPIWLTTENADTEPALTNDHLGIKSAAGTWSFSTADGTTEQTTDISASISAATPFATVITFDGTTAKCYLNGTLVATHATNVPRSTGYTSPGVERIYINTTGTSTVLNITEFDFLFVA